MLVFLLTVVELDLSYVAFLFFSFGFCVSEVKKKFNVKDRLFLMSLKMLGFMSYIVGVIVCLLFFFRH